MKIKKRKHTCLSCGATWVKPLQRAKHTSNISGEVKEACPKCCCLEVMSAEPKFVEEKKHWLGKRPENCDICGELMSWISNKQWWVDGATTMGPWANMCPRCFEKYGRGLGLGKGQKYDVNTLEKTEG